MALTRRRALTALSLAPLAALTACSTGAVGGSAGRSAPATAVPTSGERATADPAAFPVTVPHVYGETVVEAPPTRIATVSWVNADVALALDVVPVGMPVTTWGGNEHGTTPWIDARLAELGAPIDSEAAPVLYDETDGLAFDDLAALAPDIILGAYSGMSQEAYDRLTGIAPVVAFPETAFGTAWQESTRMIGQALGMSGPAEEIVADVEAVLASQTESHPALDGTTFIYGNIDPTATPPINIYTGHDNRPKFLTSLGMVAAPVSQEATASTEAFYVEWSAERASELESDVFVTWVADESVVETITTDPLLSRIPAVEAGSLVAHTDPTRTLAISAASPLSLPWAVDEVVPMIAEAAAAAR